MAELPPCVIPQTDTVVYQSTEVIIVGAGPVGLFLALKLSLKGVDVLVLEAEPDVLQSPRATTYMPIVLNEMDKVGLVNDLIKAGHTNREGIQFRKSHAKGGELLGSLRMSQVPKGTVKYDFAGIHLGQHIVSKIILEHCQMQPSFRILWKRRYGGAKQTAEQDIEVIAAGPLGEKFFTCHYLIGCDSAGSAVRRSLCIPFEGFTWNDFRFVASNVRYDFEKHGFTTANMIIDEEDWAVIARTGPGDEPWRVAFGIPTDIPESDIMMQLPEKYERLLPGPRPLKYEIVSANPFWAHQRCAKTFKVGRIVLCGDAAHSNNPIGGLGLTTGFLDAAALGTCLLRILVHGEEADPLLSRYAEVRRAAWLNYTNKASIDFKLRLHSGHPEVVAQRDIYLHALKTDPDVHTKAASSMNETIEDMFEVLTAS
ncbi:FAD NAD(P)-binding domain-containing [Fusarium albosuccineum]|uniref:FAD NAD(P)-binding domain-containing n=1 Tax=Fusarium albosuccineum TaxID=1237068 RepID=A0A8H4KU71_9HYPO|nr:FAD NAD(P)-binding domain-containing [Fusarium albosuccineum]